MMVRALKYLWVAPWTLIGVLAGIVAVGTGGRVAWRAGVLESSGGLWRWVFRRVGPRGGIAAITIGHTVIADNENGLHQTRAHERVHVAQFERWGPFFPLLYVAASGSAWLRGRHFYYDNHFEREARRLTS